MKCLLTLLMTAFSLFVCAQVDTMHAAILSVQFDHAEMALWEMHTKEMSTPGMELNEYEREVKRNTLTRAEANRLMKLLVKPGSYDQTRALLYHYNLVIEFINDSTAVRVMVSTITGNIDIENKVNGKYFRNNTKGKLNKRLLHLMRKYQLIELLDEFDLEGIK